MPRLPVDGKKVIEHRITFGTKERDMIESALTAFQFNRVATPVVAGMSDVSFMLVAGSLLTIFFPDIVLPAGKAGAGEVADAITAGIKTGYARAEEEREMTGEATLDDSTGIRDALGRAWFNLTNPNWSFGGDAPGVREAWAEGPGKYF
jgi:hypothetical protein